MVPGGPLDFEDDPGDEVRRARLARRRDPDLAAEGRGPEAGRPAGASRYGWFVGAVGVLVVAAVTVSSLGSDGPSLPGGIAKGAAAPPFAAPLASSRLEGDVNVAVRAGAGDAGAVPACSILRPDVLNLCALYGRGPVVLAFFAPGGEECVTQIDALDDAATRHRAVRFAAVSIRGSREGLRRTVRDRGWRLPVGYDRDGILATLYGVAACPQITFVRRGGTVQDTSLGPLGAAELEARVRRLER